MARRPTGRAGRMEAQYAVQLRRIAAQIGKIISGWFPPGEEFDLAYVSSLQRALDQYAARLIPWATATGARMVEDVNRKNKRQWAANSADMSRELKRQIEDAPVGVALRGFLDEQVGLITSLPVDAGKRVHKIALEAKTSGARYDALADEIRRSGQVTASRATLIARTETARVASGLTMVRAQHVGSEEYIWRTAKDGDVRHSHKMMEGKVVRWTDPPELDGMVGHAGMLPNCRCYPEPIIPEF